MKLPKDYTERVGSMLLYQVHFFRSPKVADKIGVEVTLGLNDDGFTECVMQSQRYFFPPDASEAVVQEAVEMGKADCNALFAQQVNRYMAALDELMAYVKEHNE